MQPLRRPYRSCPGCGRQFFPNPDDSLWCEICRLVVKTIHVEVSESELRRFEAQAFVRGCTVPEMIRLAINEFANRRGNRSSADAHG